MFHRKIAITAIVLFLLATALGLCSCRDTLRTAENNFQLRVMTFNIRYGTAEDGPNHWENRRQMVFDVLRDNRPDVVGLQEARRFQIDEIRKALPQYDEVGVARDNGETGGEYTTILYLAKRFRPDESGTFWLSDTPDVPGSTHWGNSLPRICTWARLIEKKSGRAFYLYNTHLDHKSQPSREKSVVLLSQYISERRYQEPFVLTGDFNAGENNPAILYLKGKVDLGAENENKLTNPVVMVDTFRLLYPDAVDVGTFNGFWGKRRGSKIDFIFVQPGTKVLEAEIIRTERNGRYPSDHFPVSTLINLSSTPKH